MRKVPVGEGILPIKVYEAMSCARPIVLALDGEARRMAEQEAGAAIYVEPENDMALASAIVRLYEHRELAAELGPRARAYVEAQFDYCLLTAMLSERISVAL